MSTDTRGGADSPNPSTSSAATGSPSGDADWQQPAADRARSRDGGPEAPIMDNADAASEHPTPPRDAQETPLLAEEQRAKGGYAGSDPAERDVPASAVVVEPSMLTAPAEAELAQPPDLEVWSSDEDQLTDPAYVPPTYANEAPPVDPWAQTTVSPDYVPPHTPPYANAAPEEEPFPRAPGFPPRYAPPVYPLPAVRRSRLPLLGVLIALGLAALVVLVLVRGVFSAPGRSATGPLYSSAMTSSSSDWPNDNECYFKSDGYHIVGATNCYYSGAQYQDATVTVTTKLLKGDAQGAYGIAFRRPSPDNFYIFLVNASGDWFTVKDNTLLQKAQFSSAIKTGVGATNTLAVRMQGDHFTFFANGMQLGSLTDGTYTTGAVGLAGDTNLDVAYRDFTVTRP